MTPKFKVGDIVVPIDKPGPRYQITSTAPYEAYKKYDIRFIPTNSCGYEHQYYNIPEEIIRLWQDPNEIMKEIL